MKCLETGKICPSNNLKCKECKLMDCKKALELIEEEQKMYFKTKEQKFAEELKKEYPLCVNCSQLEILDLEKGKVRCPYMIRKKCVIK